MILLFSDESLAAGSSDGGVGEADSFLARAGAMGRETEDESSGQLRGRRGKRQAQGKDGRVWTDSDQRIQTHACSEVSGGLARQMSPVCSLFALVDADGSGEDGEDGGGRLPWWRLRGKRRKCGVSRRVLPSARPWPSLTFDGSALFVVCLVSATSASNIPTISDWAT